MRSTYALAWRYLRQRRGRALLTGVGIALGVALIVGVQVANASTARRFDSLIASISGRADVMLTPVGTADAALAPSEVERLRRLDGVDLAAASVAMESRAEVRRDSGSGVSYVWLEGVDPGLDARLRSWDLVAGEFPRPGASHAVVDRSNSVGTGAPGVRLGERVEVETPSGRRTLTVSGIVSEAGFGGRSGGGAITVAPRVLTSVETARDLTQIREGYNTVAVLLAGGVEPETWIEEHRDELRGLDATSTASAQREFRNLLDLFLSSLTWVASISLFIAAFLIYLTLNRAVAERTRTLGIMRAVGAARRQVRTAVLAEAAFLGAVATIIGVPFGLVVAAGVTRLLQAVAGFPPMSLVVPARALVAGAIVGIVTTLVAALLPARHAARIRPAEAIRSRPGAGLRTSKAWIVGAAFIAAGTGLGFVRSSNSGIEFLLVYGVTISTLLGCVLLVPLVLRPLSWLLGLITSRLARGTGTVSVRHLVRERSRSAYTLGLIMVVLAGLFTFGAVDASMARAAETVFEAQFGTPDALVRADRGVLPAEAEARVAAHDAVRRTASTRFATTRLPGRDRTVNVLIVDPDTYFDVAGFAWSAGDERSAIRGLESGGVLVAEVLAGPEDIRRGEQVAIETNRGARGFRVVGTIQSVFGIDAVMGLEAAREWLNAGRPATILVVGEQGIEPEQLAGALSYDLRDLGVQAWTMDLLRTELDDFGLRDVLRVFLAIMFVAAVIGLLGLANTLAMSISDRMREIGIMRATGASRGQVRRMVLAESITLGLAAFALAVPVGWMMSALVVRGASVEGLPLRFTYPAAWVGILVVCALAISAVAALGPALRAGRLRPAEILRFE